MAASSRNARSTTASPRPSLSSAGFHRSISPSGRLYSPTCHHYYHHHPQSRSPSYSHYYTSPTSSASAFASSTSSSFSSTRSPSFFHHHQQQQQRATSPNRVNFLGSSAPTPSVRFSIGSRSSSPGRSLATYSSRDHQIVKKLPVGHQHHHHHPQQRRTCMCSPTTHPGSFRCSLHKNAGFTSHSVSAPSNRLNARRSAMTNSLVRIGTVEGDLVKRALAALIRPSSHQQRRRAAFQPRPSRLSVMSKAGDDDDQYWMKQVRYY